jgi:hypothetical protein
MVLDSMMPYDPHPVTSAPLQRPGMATQFFPTTTYSPAPVTSMAAPHYQSQIAFGGFGSYNSTPPSSVVSPFKPQYPERSQLRIMPSSETEGTRNPAYPRDNRSSYLDGSPSPSIKSETQMSSARSVTLNPSAAARTITSNVSVNGANQVTFNTDVDALMKAIQSKEETEIIVKKADTEQIPYDPMVKAPEQVGPALASSQEESVLKKPQQQQEGKPNRKQYRCDIEGCNKSFYQKTHLDIHRRAHTGDKPYVSTSCFYTRCLPSR